MEISTVLRLIVILAGIALIWIDFITYVRRKITESIGLVWFMFSLVLILIGALPALSGWSKTLNTASYLAVFVVSFFVVLGLFLLCIAVSQLTMKNQELAMQVSLLNQENERILHELEEITGKNKASI